MRPSGLNAYWPESKPLAYVARTVAPPPLRSAFTIWFAEVSYATVAALTNCGERAVVSKVHTLRAWAGSWISRTTTVGSPTTVPITRLSPAGTAVAQWTAEAIVVGVVPAEGLDNAAAVEVSVGEEEGSVCPPGAGDPPHAASGNGRKRATPAARSL